MTMTVTVKNTTSDRSAKVEQSQGSPEAIVPPGASQDFTVHDGNAVTVSEVDAQVDGAAKTAA